MEIEGRGCPWFHRYSSASFAADSVIRLLGGPLGFASPNVQRLFKARSGFAFRLPTTIQFQDVPFEDLKFAGAVLSKFSHRGTPAPCSLKVERHILSQAQKAKILHFEELSSDAIFEFTITPIHRDLPFFLKACLLPELLIPDSDVDSLITCYRSLCTEGEWLFFEKLISFFPDKRLALLVTPQRYLRTMAEGVEMESVNEQGQVDFAIEIPDFNRDTWLKIAIEIDDASHEGIRKEQDKKRNELLQKAGWQEPGQFRFLTKESNDWDSRIQSLVKLIVECVSKEILSGAKTLRALPDHQRCAIENLVLLPLAESQILSFVAERLYEGASANLTVSDPQGLGLTPVIEAVGDTIDAISGIHHIEGLRRPSLSLNEESVDLNYFAIPSPSAWSSLGRVQSGTIAPRAVSGSYVEPLFPALPRAAHSGEGEDNTKRFESYLIYLLQNVFRKVKFRDKQSEIIKRALLLQPVVGLLPTAAGKSLCYQLVSFLQPGCTLVVSPLRSLMTDQQGNLKGMGIHRSLAIMSGMEATEADERRLKEEGYRLVELGHHIFVFVSPERLQIPEFRSHVKSFVANVPIPYCVVDEAHCVSEWGHDFRPAYLNVGRLVRNYCVHNGSQPSLLALTGTASRNVLIDIMRELELDDQNAVVEPKSFDRKELNFEVVRVSSEDRFPVLAGKIRSILMEYGWRPGQPSKVPVGLVFSYFVNDQTVGIPRLKAELERRLRIPVELYAGTAPLEFRRTELEWEHRKLLTQRKFKYGEIPILACSHAFGMGVDILSLRWTVHAMLPRSVEEFYQQAGRAGRDFKRSQCTIIFSDDQPTLADELLDTERTSLEEIASRANEIPREKQGDAIRDTWFITKNFLGREREKTLLKFVISDFLMPNLPKRKEDTITLEIPFTALPDRLFVTTADKGRESRKERDQKVDEETKSSALEKTLYRLLLIEAIPDYQKDYTARSFHAVLKLTDASEIYGALEHYIRRYAAEGEVIKFIPETREYTYEKAVFSCGSALIDYIYEAVEKRRRRAIGQMLEVARRGSEGEDLRKLILIIMEESEFTEPVDKLSWNKPEEWFKLLSSVKGVDGISKLVGACLRRLVDDPNHPGLLLLGGLCRCSGPDPKLGLQDVRGAFIVLKRDYPQLNRQKIARESIMHVERLFPSHREEVLLAILEGDPSLELARTCYELSGIYSEARHFASRILVKEILETFPQKEVSHERARAD